MKRLALLIVLLALVALPVTAQESRTETARELALRVTLDQCEAFGSRTWVSELVNAREALVVHQRRSEVQARALTARDEAIRAFLRARSEGDADAIAEAVKALERLVPPEEG